MLREYECPGGGTCACTHSGAACPCAGAVQSSARIALPAAAAPVPDPLLIVPCTQVRCLAADDALLVSGSSDHRIRVWDLRGNIETEAEGGGDLCKARPGGVSLAQRAVLAGGHSGPVTAVELTEGALFSGSWDYSVRWAGFRKSRACGLLQRGAKDATLFALPPDRMAGSGRLVRRVQLFSAAIRQA